MKRKEVNRCSREWEESVGDVVERVRWTERWGGPLIQEVKRLRSALKRSTKKKRRARGDLELEQIEFDALVDELESLITEIPSDPLADINGYWLSKRLNEILAKFIEIHEGA